MCNMFRALRADEIEVRVAQNKEKGCQLLLYKDARCDMNILDEAVGPMNWMRQHDRDNANCIVSLWDKEKGQWISKEDTGTESNTEAEKGLASDSFKRACFNWGIGRELYTSPFIWIPKSVMDVGKYDKFHVSDICVQNGRITALVICDSKTGKVVFDMGASKKPTPAPITCARCGKEITPITLKSGGVMPPAMVAQNTQKLYGQPMCAGCWEDAKRING